MSRLRSQDNKPLLPPASIHSLLEAGRIPPWKVDEALGIFQADRKTLLVQDDFEAGERILFLTMSLANHFIGINDRRWTRALVESAAEAVRVPRHRQTLYGYLSRQCTFEGDLRGAERWLTLMDPLSDDLQSDSAYRLSRALLDTARRDWRSVLETLGGNATQVPILDAMDAMATVLRANAWENSGNLDAAVDVLREHMGAGGASGRQTIAAFVKAYESLGLCRASLSAAESAYGAEASKRAAARAGGGIGKMLLVLGVGMLLGGVVSLILGLANVAPTTSMATLLIPGLILFFVGRGLHRAAKNAAYLRAHGIGTHGSIVKIGRTGTKINGVPQYQITLSVRLEGQSPYQASTRLLLPDHAAAQLQPGTTVPVRVAPGRPDLILIEAD